jgi:TPR repeat protein
MRAAAENGYPVAQHGLGFMYLEGECVEKDPAQAVAWFQKAADQGLLGSLTTLAMMYEEGKGVPQDLEKANELYRAAGFER